MNQSPQARSVSCLTSHVQRENDCRTVVVKVQLVLKLAIEETAKCNPAVDGKIVVVVVVVVIVFVFDVVVVIVVVFCYCGCCYCCCCYCCCCNMMENA